MDGRQILAGSEKRRLPNAKLIGLVDDSEHVEVSVLLKLPKDKTALDLKPHINAAPGKGRHLTREEYDRRFASPIGDLIRVENFARAEGLAVVEASAERRCVVLAGTARQMSRAFGTQLSRYRHPDGGTFRGRSGPLLIPSAIADIVDAVLGLDDRPVARPHLRRVEARAIGAAKTPSEVARLYQFPDNDAPGQGQCIALIELGGGYRLSDLSTYFSSLGLPMPKVTAVSVDGGQNAPGVDTDADGEVMLDIEVAGAVAPASTIAVYFAPNTDRGFLDAISTAIHDKHNAPSVISISWGSAEARWTEQSLRAFDQVFQIASALGISICAAAGDNGSADGMSDGLQHVDFPASSPYVLACGGTRLVAVEGGGISETVWNDAPDSATGGGISDFFDPPEWQAGLDLVSKNLGGRKGRGVPDVSGNADPETGYKVLVDGQNTVIGGTSAVAPLWAGLIALLNQKLARSVGYLQPFIYRNPKQLNDIQTGNNGAYDAKPGWDCCTGYGSPNGKRLLQALSQDGQ